MLTAILIIMQQTEMARLKEEEPDMQHKDRYVTPPIWPGTSKINK